MKHDDKIKLDVISNIDSELIDKVSEQRIKYIAANERAINFLSARFYAAAASILLLISSVITALIFIFGKTPPPVDTRQVPIYKGMTVSSEAPSTGGSTASLLCTKPYSEVNAIYTALGEPTPEQNLYYARPNEDIYITVHLDNPDSFEILSFTLNGKKYTSYMFEDGSDLENLVLKVNVGNVTGLISYTIDAIKYVDDDRIKDVTMQGDKTVNIGVYNERQPTAAISNLKYDSESISFLARVTDTEGLIEATYGRLFARLYKNGTTVAEKELFFAGETCSVSFENLEQGSYEYAVVAEFDAYDGNGYYTHVLKKGSFSNEIKLDFTRIFLQDLPDKKIIFNVESPNELVTVEKIEIVRKSDGRILGTTFDPTARAILIDGEVCGTAYIKTSGFYNVKNRTESCEFISEEFSIPAQPLREGEMGRLFDNEHPFYESATESWRTHQGIDFFPTTDDLGVYSCTDGRVIAIEKNTSLYGTVIKISDVTGYTYIYRLLEKATVSVGDAVSTGDLIGKIGTFTEGFEGADGPHLHLEVHNSEKIPVTPKIPPSPKKILEHELELNKVIKTKKCSGTSIIYIGANAVGQTYSDVMFDYSCDNDIVSITGTSIKINLSNIDQDVFYVTITINATYGDKTKTIEHTIEVEKL